MTSPWFYALAAALVSANTLAADPLTRPIASPYAKEWLKPQRPLRIHGDTYYVGFGGLSLVLIDSKAGLILIDGALPQAVPAIAANIQQLGFNIEDVKYILNTEAHFDHAGGIAALARDSGAITVSSPAGIAALAGGHVLANDPQAGQIDAFAPVSKLQAIGDGETLHLGNTAISAHFTPGHTPGSTSWSWRSCQNGQCVDIVFGASLNAVSADRFHFSAAANQSSTAVFRSGIRNFAQLPCDILISAHPDHSGFDQKLQQAARQPASNPFIDPQACRNYAAKYEQKLDARLAREAAGAHE
ncbi:subclass B3 metallo-beta-lactamase [Janthinobacterium agaricidamnosum]|uniref:Metallo-beta-lactamase superfamily protein n=1 Tax=Janthinobacterium agaricidamnosum NBRC 102515 = DSM 9628 TaxID=1349767 RepID=W0V814_9BURK|nr:subclass B3 metallo-beta-lactamase [Janthinobacterium agaricidamnosum]CDG83473.1 metallo-beta-lactamase superfamily protein [Janthinobacterium agaricidamnosum NBRC 102515 = DSM 9628]